MEFKPANSPRNDSNINEYGVNQNDKYSLGQQDKYLGNKTNKK